MRNRKNHIAESDKLTGVLIEGTKFVAHDGLLFVHSKSIPLSHRLGFLVLLGTADEDVVIKSFPGEPSWSTGYVRACLLEKWLGIPTPSKLLQIAAGRLGCGI
ncbi:MAG: hypothetical protein EXS31_09710 [Pedosphaera sp.]|nr:hypothetical protein [Pedosphaera sp.]